MSQHRLVGFEDDVVLRTIGLAILRFGDLPEIVALLDRVEDGFFRRRFGDLQFTRLDLGNAERIANRDDRLFENRLIGHFALQNDLVVHHFDLNLVRAEIVGSEFLFDRFDIGGIITTADTKLLSRFLDEIDSLLLLDVNRDSGKSLQWNTRETGCWDITPQMMNGI